jgi:hypothetical protein
MAQIFLSARFDNLNDAEGAATELRAAFGTEVDIRSMSENQSARDRVTVDERVLLAYPAMNLGSPTPSPASALAMGLPGLQADSNILLNDRAYVLEANINEEDVLQAREILERYRAKII